LSLKDSAFLKKSEIKKNKKNKKKQKKQKGKISK